MMEKQQEGTVVLFLGCPSGATWNGISPQSSKELDATTSLKQKTLLPHLPPSPNARCPDVMAADSTLPLSKAYVHSPRLSYGCEPSYHPWACLQA